MTREEIATAETQLARARERVGDVTIRSPGTGKFVAPRPLADLVGRYVHQGDLIGYVVGPAITTARVVLPQSQVALVRDRTRSVELRLVERVGEVLDGSIRRQVPAATYRLPSRALGTSGGGALPVDPADPDGLRTLERVFQLDIDLPQSGSVREIGGRVHVRFHHGYEPVAWRAFRALRRLFLRRLGV
jgi:putative peptide zinc metalloprotease protein